MNIKPTDINRVANVYKQNLAGQVAKPGDVPDVKKMDTVDISDKGMLMSEFGKVISTVAEEVHGSVSPERLEALSSSIKAGTYVVSAEEIADSILGRLYA